MTHERDNRRTMRRSLTRRQAVRAGLIAVAGVAAGPVATAVPAGEKADPKMGYIDAHVHVWTPDTSKYPLAAGFTREQMSPASFTPDELFRHARPTGVARVVLIQMSYYGFDNSYMLDAIREHPGVFVGVAVIDEDDKPGQTMRKLMSQKVRGFRITPFKRKDKWLDGEGMVEMWKTGAETGQAMCCLINPDNLPQVDAMCQRHPSTPVLIDHFARIGVDGAVRTRDLDNLCRLARHKKTSVKISAYYALGKKKSPYTDLAPMIKRLLDAYGPERLMWASDCPFQVVEGHNYADSIDLIKTRLDFLSAGDKSQLLRGTAERVFFG